MAISLALSYQDGLDAYDRAIEKGEETLHSMGFPPAERPVDSRGDFGDRPSLPPRLSALSISELQDLMGWFTSWHSYALESLPQVYADRNAASNKKDFVWAVVRAEKRGKTKQDKDDETRTDARYVEANTKYEALEYIHKRISSVCKGLEREIDTISRAQSALENKGKTYGQNLGGERSVARSFGRSRGSGDNTYSDRRDSPQSSHQGVLNSLRPRRRPRGE